MSSEVQQEIARVVERMTPDRAPARRAAEGGPAIDRAMWTELAELGLATPALPERLGGSGVGLAEEAIIAERMASVAAPLPITTAFLAAHILGAGDSEAGAALAAAFAAGETVVGAALSADAGIPPDVAVSAEGDRGFITGEIADLMDGAALDVFLIPADGRWWAVEAAATGVAREELQSLDFTRRLASVTFSRAPAVAVSAMPIQDVLALAWTLLAAEGVGVVQTALDITSRYALDRTQFGEQIGRFQAIKHMLANCLVAVEGARSALFGAVSSARDGVPDPRMARMAKICASNAGPSVVADCVQMHGAIANTWEHDMHLLLRRAKGVQLSLGSGDFHLDRLGEDLTAESATKARSRTPARTNDAESFALDEADRAFIAEFRTWLDEHSTPEKLNSLRTHKSRREWQAEMADAGWAGIHWPKEYGGRDATFIQQVLYHTELASRSVPGMIGNRGLSLTAPTIIAHGTPYLKKLLVEPTRRADILWASGFSEPSSGSDLASIRTKGVVDGDDMVINGMKIWTSGAHYCEWMYTLVRTGPLVPKHSGISCIMIPLNAPGITIRPIRRMSGDPEFNEVFLEDVRVPLANMLGGLNEGWKVFKTTLAHEHSTNFLGAQLRQAFLVERIIGQLGKREGQVGIDHGLRRRVAQAWINTQLLRLHGLRNMASIVEGGAPGAEGSVLKLFGQEEEKRVYELAVDVRGGSGLAAYGAGRAFLGSKAATVGGGTSEIHRNKIAERVLGMPRDIWADDWA